MKREMQLVTVRENGTKKCVTINDMPSETVVSQQDETDIQHILAKYEQSGIVAHMQDVDLMFRDVTEFEDYRDLAAQDAVAKEEFMTLPSKVREVFGHNYANWLEAAHNPEYLAELKPKLVELGIAQAADIPEPKAGAGAPREPAPPEE